MTDRAVSVTVNYVLTLTITTLLLSGLVVSAGGLIESQSERAIESELDVLGQQLAADIESADRLATINETEDTEVKSVEIETRLPTRVAGTGYTIDVDQNKSSSEWEIELRSTDPEVLVDVPIMLSEGREAETVRTIQGGNVRIGWEDGNRMVIESA